MASATPQHPFSDFDSIYNHLLTLPAPLRPPGKPNDSTLTGKISALSLHPTIETALHLFNNDLPSAHFLVRHMQSAPAFEGMFLHGVLHRLEGDYDNARAWYDNVKASDVFQRVWPEGLEDAQKFLAQIENLVKKKQGSEEELMRASLREMKAIMQFCQEKFGKGEFRDASDAFVKNDARIQAMSNGMTTGSEGFRKF